MTEGGRGGRGGEKDECPRDEQKEASTLLEGATRALGELERARLRGRGDGHYSNARCGDAMKNIPVPSLRRDSRC